MNLDRIAGRLESLAKYCSNASEQLRLAEKQDFWQATDFERLYLPGVKLACFDPECEASLQNKADLHIHTRASDGDEIERVIERALSLKLDAIAITDHDCLDGAIEARRKVHDEGLHLAIIPGIEVSSAEGHIGALFVNKPVPKGLSLSPA